MATASPANSAPTLPPSPAAPRHEKLGLVQPTGDERSQDLFHRTARLRDYLDRRRAQQRFERSGDGPAEQHVHAVLREFGDASPEVTRVQGDRLAAAFAVPIKVDEDHRLRHVEHGRDAVSERGDGDVHCLSAMHTLCHIADPPVVWAAMSLL